MNKTFTSFLVAAICVISVTAKPKPLFFKQDRSKPISNFGKTGSSKLPQLTKSFSWDPVNEVWTLSDSMVSSYSATGVLLEDMSNGMERKIYSTSSNGSVWQELTLSKNQSTSVWDSAFLNIIKYDSHGNDTLNENFNYVKNNGTWSKWYGEKKAFTYNTYNQMVKETRYEFDSGSYKPTQELNFLYNTQGNVFQVQMNKWDTASNSFVSDIKITDIVWHQWITDPYRSLLDSYRLMLYMGGGVYLDGEKIKIYYDIHNEEIQTINEKFDGTNWYVDSKDTTTLTYNADTAITERIRMEYDLGNNVYLNSEKYEYSNFFMFSTGILQRAGFSRAISVYPNPVEEMLSIDIPSNSTYHFELIDLTGKRVQFEMCNRQHNQIELKVNQGIYLYRIISNQQIIDSGKLIVR